MVDSLGSFYTPKIAQKQGKQVRFWYILAFDFNSKKERLMVQKEGNFWGLMPLENISFWGCCGSFCHSKTVSFGGCFVLPCNKNKIMVKGLFVVVFCRRKHEEGGMKWSCKARGNNLLLRLVDAWGQEGEVIREKGMERRKVFEI